MYLIQFLDIGFLEVRFFFVYENYVVFYSLDIIVFSKFFFLNVNTIIVFFYCKF